MGHCQSASQPTREQFQYIIIIKFQFKTIQILILELYQHFFTVWTSPIEKRLIYLVHSCHCSFHSLSEWTRLKNEWIQFSIDVVFCSHKLTRFLTSFVHFISCFMFMNVFQRVRTLKARPKEARARGSKEVRLYTLTSHSGQQNVRNDYRINWIPTGVKNVPFSTWSRMTDLLCSSSTHAW